MYGDEQSEQKLSLVIVVVFYSIVTLLGLGIHLIFGEGSLLVPGEWGGGGLGRDWWHGVLVGIGMAVLVIILDIFCERHFKWAREFSQGLKGFIGKLKSWEIGVIALCSGIAEEIFFRGALLSLIGLIGSSVLFGLLHWGGGGTKPWIWPLISTILGFALGLLTLWSGSLLGAVIAHFTINFVNLQRMMSLEDVVRGG